MLKFGSSMCVCVCACEPPTLRPSTIPDVGPLNKQVRFEHPLCVRDDAEGLVHIK